MAFADPDGGRRTSDAHRGQNFYVFHAFFGEDGQNNRLVFPFWIDIPALEILRHCITQIDYLFFRIKVAKLAILT